MDGFVALRCTQCGGKVEITKEVFESNFQDIGGGEVIFRSVGEKIACESCGTEFLPKTVIEKYDGAVAVVVNTGGGAYFNGNLTITNGSFTGRDSVTIVHNERRY